MITLITGAPGAGKTAALVSLLAELSKDRTIYVNGIPDLAIDHQVLDDPTKWTETVPDGSIVVVDEVQRFWRPRGPGSKVPPEIAAMEVHRHRGIDFYVITQSPRLVDANIRGLVGRHVHLRDIGFLGRWWYEWPECADSCAAGWKNAPLKKRYRLPKAIFGKYKSASLHVKPVRSFPWMVLILIGALIAGGVLAWRTYTTITAKIQPKSDVLKLSDKIDGKPESKGWDGASAPARLGYDRSAFIPPVSAYPESAPAYDHLRVVTAMPLVVAGFCSPSVCRCFTQQGTEAIFGRDCRDWVERPRFDPYRVPYVNPGAASNGAPVGGTPSASSHPATVSTPTS